MKLLRSRLAAERIPSRCTTTRRYSFDFEGGTFSLEQADCDHLTSPFPISHRARYIADALLAKLREQIIDEVVKLHLGEDRGQRHCGPGHAFICTGPSCPCFRC